MKDSFGRVCRKCNIYKPWEEFSTKTTRGIVGKQPKCKICAAYETRLWYINNKDKAKDTALQRAYGMCLVEYKERLIQQKYTCLICSKVFSEGNFGPDSPVVDHCHIHGHVRGIICNECNRGIGYFRDNPTALRNAATYLEEN